MAVKGLMKHLWDYVPCESTHALQKDHIHTLSLKNLWSPWVDYGNTQMTKLALKNLKHSVCVLKGREQY